MTSCPTPRRSRPRSGRSGRTAACGSIRSSPSRNPASAPSCSAKAGAGSKRSEPGPGPNSSVSSGAGFICSCLSRCGRTGSRTASATPLSALITTFDAVAGSRFRAGAAPLFDDPDRLAGLAAAAALLSATLPEREPHADVFASFAALLEALASAQDWQARYIAWECDLLAALGFGLDLSCCAATGATADLAYVSPKSGRAVSRGAGLPYHDKLLPLPAFLWRSAPATASELALGLELTGYFLWRHLLSPQRRPLPAARAHLLARIKNGRGG